MDVCVRSGPIACRKNRKSLQKIKKSGVVVVVVFVPGVNESLEKSVSEYLEKGGKEKKMGGK